MQCSHSTLAAFNKEQIFINRLFTLTGHKQNFSSGQTIVFIDSTLEDYPILVNQVNVNAQIVILNPQVDGIAQITEALQKHTDTETVHLVTHGSPGCLYLGKSQLSLDTINNYASQLKNWCISSLLLYGCQVAAGEAGIELITLLQDLTGATIVASTTTTGNAAKGGTWELNVTTGYIDIPLAFAPTVKETYPGILATFVVNTLEDENDGLSDGGISLREAVIAANSNVGVDRIEFDTRLSGGTITLTRGELNINDAVTINGLGADQLTIDANRNSRIFVIDDSKDNNQIEVSVDGLKLTEGYAQASYYIDYYTGEFILYDDGSGGGIKNKEKLTITNSIINNNTSSSFFSLNGSGIDNEGDLTLISSIVSGNIDGSAIVNRGNARIINTTISDNNNNNSNSSGGIGNFGNLTITNSTISNNSGYIGAGIINSNNGNTTIINSTISGNQFTYQGGGIFNYGGKLKIKNSTITQNKSQLGSGGIYSNNNENSLIEVSNSIVSGNSNGDVVLGEGSNTVFYSQGSNIIGTGNAIANFNQTGDAIGITDPGLENLANNGGFTQTHALKPDSPAINSGNNALITQDTADLDADGDTNEPLPVDQRGEPRIGAETVDIGAFESNFNFIPLPTVSLIAIEAFVVEGEQEAIYRLSRAGNRSNPLNVILTGVGSNGLTVDDFNLSTVSGTFPNFTVTIPAGQSFVELKLTAINEFVLEGDETLTLSFVADEAYKIDPVANGDKVTLFDPEGFLVTNINDSSLGSLRQAILNANLISGTNTIIFDASLIGKTITLTSGELAITDDLIIKGLGAKNLTISGNNNSRIFNINDGNLDNNIEVEIQGLKINQGRTSLGGSIFNAETLAVTNTLISGNTANERGGGIYNSGNLVLTNSTISDNIAELYAGGGINNDRGGTVILNNSTISGNTAAQFGDGGGIYNFLGSVGVINSIIANNRSVNSGGGIDSYSYDDFTVINSTISNNTSSSGGGIGLRGGSLTVTNSTISDNVANFSSGGAILNSGTLTMTNSTISGNKAIDDGGGISNRFGHLILTNSTITNNTASHGGGLFNFSIPVEVGNTIIALNLDNFNDSPDISGSFTSKGSNLIGNSIGGRGFTNGVNGDLVGTSTAPINPRLGSLQNNGGLNQTHTLLPNSPAIDTGSNPNNLLTDQRGTPRVVGNSADIGAVEVTDTKIGNQNSNSFTGEKGSDFLDARGGNDALNGGSGNDGLRGGSGSDRLTGSQGNDIIIGGADRDILLGGSGSDVFLFEFFTDSLVTAPDRIRDFNQSSGDRFSLLPTNPSAAFNAGVVDGSNLIEAVQAAYGDKNQAQGGNQALGINEAVLFTIGTRTYLSINNNITEFNPNLDLVAEVSGIILATGDENAGVLGVSNYFI